jgi:hypothetical protein
VRLLADCREVLNGHQRISTADLIERLSLLEESPWGEKWWDTYKGEARRGAASNLAWHLRRYGIHSKTIRFETGLAKGYEKVAFEDVFDRYLAPSPDLSRNSRNNPHEQRDSGLSATRNKYPNVTAQEEPSNPHENSDVTDVTAETPRKGQERPRIGNEMFPVLLAEAVRDGFIDHDEAEERYALHKLVTQAENDGAGVGR